MVELIKAPPPVQTKATDSPRIVRGIASTANVDRHNETVNPRGIAWKLPVPLLANHDHRAVIGRVTELTATNTELRFVAELSRVTELARQSWDLIQDGTLSGVSIGFIGRQHELKEGGLHWKEAELLEISIVAVPSNRESRILTTAGKAFETSKHGAVQLIKAR